MISDGILPVINCVTVIKQLVNGIIQEANIFKKKGERNKNGSKTKNNVCVSVA